MTASMQRLDEGKVNVSTQEAETLEELAKVPRKRKKPMPVRFKKTQVAHENPFGVAAGQLWESRDERVKPARQLRVIDVGDEHAVMENIETGRRTTVQLRLFKPNTKRGFRLVVEDV